VRARRLLVAVAAALVAVAAVAAPHVSSPYVGAISAELLKNGRTRVLFSRNVDAEAYPASVTKLMTLLLVLEDVKSGKYRLDSKVTATPDVTACEPSWVGIRAGETMSVRDLCLALMVESANDAAIVLGVNSAGSLPAFVARMNARAAELGMTHTRYYNPNGLPPSKSRRYPWKQFNVSTAADQLRLAVELLGHPEALCFTSVKTCQLIKTPGGYRVAVVRRVGSPEQRVVPKKGETVVKTLCNHNNVMVKDKLKLLNPDGREAVDGLKTGYIDAGGSSVVITGQRNGKRVVAVVLGSTSSKERDAAARKLVSDALSAVAW